MLMPIPQDTIPMAPPPPDPNELLTPSAVADQYGMSAETVRRWIRKGIVPVVLVGPFKMKRIQRRVADKYFVTVDGAKN